MTISTPEGRGNQASEDGAARRRPGGSTPDPSNAGPAEDTGEGARSGEHEQAQLSPDLIQAVVTTTPAQRRRPGRPVWMSPPPAQGEGTRSRYK